MHSLLPSWCHELRLHHSLPSAIAPPPGRSISAGGSTPVGYAVDPSDLLRSSSHRQAQHIGNSPSRHGGRGLLRRPSPELRCDRASPSTRYQGDGCELDYKGLMYCIEKGVHEYRDLTLILMGRQPNSGAGPNTQSNIPPQSQRGHRTR
jgi:hypothetical protein